MGDFLTNYIQPDDDDDCVRARTPTCARLSLDTVARTREMKRERELPELGLSRMWGLKGCHSRKRRAVERMEEKKKEPREIVCVWNPRVCPRAAD